MNIKLALCLGALTYLLGKFSEVSQWLSVLNLASFVNIVFTLFALLHEKKTMKYV